MKVNGLTDTDGLTGHEEAALEDFFAAARQSPPDLPAGLSERVIAAAHPDVVILRRAGAPKPATAGGFLRLSLPLAAALAAGVGIGLLAARSGTTADTLSATSDLPFETIVVAGL